MTKPVRKIAYVDAGRCPRILELLLEFVSSEYTFQFVHPSKADFVFHSCNGEEVLRCPGVRIFITGECVTPDFNISDYAFGFDHLSYGDRYFRLPLYRLYESAWQVLTKDRPDPEWVLSQKNHFCSYVVSNTKNSAPERILVADALEQYKAIDYGGKWRNSVGGPVSDKIQFQRSRKFAIAFENYSHPGYLTEKFAEAAQSHAVPIYWGDPTVAEQFNSKAFVNAHEFSSFNELSDFITELDQNDHLYMSMLAEPWFVSGTPPLLHNEVIQDRLSSILDQDVSQAFRRNRSRWGQKLLDRRTNPMLRSLSRALNARQQIFDI